MGHFDPSVISFAIKHQMLSRMMIFGVKPRQVDPIFRFIGGGFMFLKNDYPLVGLGEKVGNQPDKEYGEWVSEFYKNVAGSGQPRYDRVTAAIQIASKKPKLLTARYERLPCGANGRILGLGSARRRNLDLITPQIG